MTLTMVILGWIAGGVLFLGGMARMDNDDAQDCFDGHRRFEPAAVVALGMFMTVWPVVFVTAKIGAMRGNR